MSLSWKSSLLGPPHKTLDQNAHEWMAPDVSSQSLHKRSYTWEMQILIPSGMRDVGVARWLSHNVADMPMAATGSLAQR